MKSFLLITFFSLMAPLFAHADNDWAMFKHKGDSCMRAYDVFHATQYYQQSIALNPSNVEVRRQLASCYRQSADNMACVSCLDNIPRDSVNHKDMRMYYYCMLDMGDKDKTAYWGDRIVATYPYDSEIVGSLATYYNDNNMPGKAEAVAKSYITQCDSTNLYVNKAYAYSLYLQFRYDEAIPVYNKLIAQGYDNFISNFVLGLCYEHFSQYANYPKAHYHLTRASKFKDNNATCFYRLALVEKELYMDSLALEHFNRAIETATPRARMCDIYKKMADLHFQHGQYEAAGRAFELSLLYDDEDTPVNYYNAAQMYIASKNDLKAKLYLQLFLSKAVRLKDDGQNKLLVSKAKAQLAQYGAR